MLLLYYMRSIGETSGSYLDEIKKRAKESKAYQPHQWAGLEIAEILNDPEHKALYIKLAKKFEADKLLRLAKNVAENKNVRNKGGYFMKLLHGNSNPGQ